MPRRNNQIHFIETLHALAGRVAGEEVPDDPEDMMIVKKLVDKLPKAREAEGAPCLLEILCAS